MTTKPQYTDYPSDRIPDFAALGLLAAAAPVFLRPKSLPDPRRARSGLYRHGVSVYPVKDSDGRTVAFSVESRRGGSPEEKRAANAARGARRYTAARKSIFGY